MTEIRVPTVPLDPRTGLFDDGPVRAYVSPPPANRILTIGPTSYTIPSCVVLLGRVSNGLRAGSIRPRKAPPFSGIIVSVVSGGTP
jgi:hypothetical protein